MLYLNFCLGYAMLGYAKLAYKLLCGVRNVLESLSHLPMLQPRVLYLADCIVINLTTDTHQLALVACHDVLEGALGLFFPPAPQSRPRRPHGRDYAVHNPTIPLQSWLRFTVQTDLKEVDHPRQ